MAHNEELKHAVELALAGDWEGAHTIAQRDETDAMSCWLHACLHKIEGDDGNARYWYGRSPVGFEDFVDPVDELHALAFSLK